MVQNKDRRFLNYELQHNQRSVLMFGQEGVNMENLQQRQTRIEQCKQKLTYPGLYGLEKSKEMARAAAHKAKEALRIFGSSASYFEALATLTVSRKQ